MSSAEGHTERPSASDGTHDRDSATWLKKFTEEIPLETIADMVAEKLKESLPNPVSLPPSGASGKGKDCYSCLGGALPAGWVIISLNHATCSHTHAGTLHPHCTHQKKKKKKKYIYIHTHTHINTDTSTPGPWGEHRAKGA